MKKKFCMTCIVLLFALYACVNESVIESPDFLKYEGKNSVSKLLVQKIQERNGSQELQTLLPSKQHEVLLDYVLLQHGFKEGIHYLIPVRNINSGEINSCVIYRVNKQSSMNLEITGAVDAPELIDIKKYLSMPDIEQKMKSIAFKKWKERGLDVNVMLYNDKLLMSRTLIEEEVNKQEGVSFSLGGTIYEGQVFYSFSLNDYLPDDVDSYAIGLERRESVFRSHFNWLLQYMQAYRGNIIVDMEKLSLVVESSVAVEKDTYIEVIDQYMVRCGNSFRVAGSSIELDYVINVFGFGGSGTDSSHGGSQGGNPSSPSDAKFWPEGHHRIIEFALSTIEYADALIPALKLGSDYADKGVGEDSVSYQAPKYAHVHAMLEVGTTVRDMVPKMRSFFTNYVMLFNKTNDYFYLGMALHPIMDSYSPAHDGAVWNGTVMEYLSHGFEASFLCFGDIEKAAQAVHDIYNAIVNEKKKPTVVFDDWASGMYGPINPDNQLNE